jgi:transglutaminase-like putative cysteine protease
MILEVRHETRLMYSGPVSESLTEVRMEPVSNADQSCRSFHLTVSPPATTSHYQDGFGNRVHHFNILEPHNEVSVCVASIVETHPRPRDPFGSRSRYPLDPEQGDLELLDFLQLRGPVSPTARLESLLEALRPRPGLRIADFVVAVCRYIHDHFEYAPAVTLASSPVEDVLQHGKGVCQDFTHLMLALLRSFGVPARYVSGYIHRTGKESQSHAWCEAWLPDLGWLGIDPTNDRLVDDHFVKVAVGRDFTDVPPNKGIYRGRAEESMFVRVATRTLDVLPALSWQEQLPPLDIPLTAIIPPRRPPQLPDEEDLSQQQQQ